MFQREMTQGQQLSPDQWNQELKKCSKQWKGMDDSAKAPFVAKALAEQDLRRTTASEPLPSKVPRGPDMPALPASAATSTDLSRNARKAISRQRVMATYIQFRNAHEWGELDAGICSPDGALDLDHIQMDMSDDEIRVEFDKFSKPAPEWTHDSHDTNLVHHSTCHADWGVCKSSKLFHLAQKFVHGLAQHVSSSSLGLGLFFW